MKKTLYFTCFSFLLSAQILVAQDCPASTGDIDIDLDADVVTVTLGMGVDVTDISSFNIDGFAIPVSGSNVMANTITLDISSLTPGELGVLGATLIDGDFTAEFAGSSTNLSCEYVDGNLPVELTSFQASLQGKAITLAWTTASEVNNEMFQVERSGDGQSFSAIGAIAGAGTTQEEQAYAFMDKFPLPGLNYYRLKQMDFDGQFEYSDIVSAWVESSSLRIYPNPTKGQVKIALPDAEANGTYQIFNPDGQVLLQGVIQEDIIDLSNINNGLYYLQINTNGRIETQKILKQ